MMRSQFSFVLVVALSILLSGYVVESFTISPQLPTLSASRVTLTLQHNDHLRHPTYHRISRIDALSSTAGNFEWEADDKTDEIDFMDQGVDNPYKKADLMDEDGTLKIDPARLLSPRMNGSNLYLVGMMGSGKSAVGRIIAKRMYLKTRLKTNAF
jgi:ABC-type uncharacterized transport system fused permease/ATPase subunit